MRRSVRVVTVVVTATLAATLAVTSRPASSADAGSESAGGSFVVLADDAGRVDDVVRAIELAGGKVNRVNRAIGLVSATGGVSFATSVNAAGGVAGVARDTPIGSARTTSVSRRDAVEREAHTSGLSLATAAAPAAPIAGEPLSSWQWDMRMMDATPAGSYARQPGRRDVLVGIIDTGIDGNHPDIAPNFNRALSRNFTRDIESIDGPCADEPDQSCDDPADVDEDGHGTHVAGTIGSPINGLGMAGVAPNVSLVNLRAGQDSGYFFLAATVDALTYAGDHGIDVVNMSFFIDPWLYNCKKNAADSPAEQAEQRTIIRATQRALDYARARGVTLVAALGNEHQDMGAKLKLDETSPDFPVGAQRSREVTNDCLDLPTEADGVIGVSSVGPSGKKADYSNHGLEQNDVAGPGGFFRDFIGTPQNRQPANLILGPYPKNVALASGAVDLTSGQSMSPFVIAECLAPGVANCAYYRLIQGTSMAAPHAAGVAALIISERGRLDRVHGGLTMDPDKVEKILLASATDTACPSALVTYAAEGRDSTYDAPCVGRANRNSIYGDGVVNALRAVR